jgi:multiple sugar transport system permease protein
MSRRLARIALHTALTALAIVTIAPLAWMVSASLMSPGEANTFPPPFLPAKATLLNYRALFTRLDIGRYALNSLLVSSAITALSVLFNAMAGYAFAKLRFRGRDRLFGVLLVALVIPAQVAMLPLFLIIRGLGLVNSFWGVIVPVMAGVFGVFLMRQYALSVPDELLDAARIDGASEFRIFRAIVLPLCRPALVTLALFMFMGAWNDFMWPLIVLSDPSKQTLPVALAALVGEHAPDTELLMAGSVLTILPVLVLFLALQRQYVAGITLGGVKE